MTERNYSTNFKLFSPTGLQAQHTVRADDLAEHLTRLTELIDGLTAMGWSVHEPTAGARNTDKVIGYMWTQFNNKKNGDIDICLSLYNERQKFRAYVVYPEKFDTLPADVRATMPHDAEDAVTVAPETNDALKRKAFHPWQATINIQPKLNDDGSIWKNEKGYPQYYYVSVVGNEPTVKREQEKAPAPSTTPSETVAAKNDQLIAPRRIFHALGQALSQEAIASDTEGELGDVTKEELWETRRAEIVAIAGKRRKPPVKLASSNDLTADELRHYIAALETKCREKIYEWADKLDMSADDLDQLLPAGSDGVENTFGATLAKTLNTLTKQNDEA